MSPSCEPHEQLTGITQDDYFDIFVCAHTSAGLKGLARLADAAPIEARGWGWTILSSRWWLIPRAADEPWSLIGAMELDQ